APAGALGLAYAIIRAEPVAFWVGDQVDFAAVAAPAMPSAQPRIVNPVGMKPNADYGLVSNRPIVLYDFHVNPSGCVIPGRGAEQIFDVCKRHALLDFLEISITNRAVIDRIVNVIADDDQRSQREPARQEIPAALIHDGRSSHARRTNVSHKVTIFSFTLRPISSTCSW